MKFSFHKVANYAAIFVFLCSILLIIGTNTVQAENNAWVLDSVEYGADPYTEWVLEVWGTRTEYSVSLGESQLKSTTKHTLSDGVVNQDVEFIFDYYTPPEVLVPGYNQGYLVIGSSTGNPYHYSSSESFMSYVDTWNYSGDRLEQIFGMQMDLDQENQSAVDTIAFKIPDLIDGRLRIKVRLGMGAQFYVHFWYEPGTVTLGDEHFALTNTSTCEGTTNDVLEPQDTGACTVKVNDLKLPQWETITTEENDQIMMASRSSAIISEDCFWGLVNWIHLQFFDGKDEDWAHHLSAEMTIVVLDKDASLCGGVNSKPYAVGSSNHISLRLQSGAGRFKPALDNLALDIETDSAKTSSVAKNDFAVGHNPDTTLTAAACFEGIITVDPTNPALSPVTLMKGQMVRVWSDRIGPITNIGQTIPGPILLLLDDGAK